MSDSGQTKSVAGDSRSRTDAWQAEIREAILAAFDDVQPSLREPTLQYPRAGGKATRPIVLFALTEMFGDEYMTVFDAGVGIEMLHVSTLIGDDHPVMDDDTYRRGVASVHRAYNEQDALLAASLLSSRGTRYCLRPAETVDEMNHIADLLDELAVNLNEGQHNDMRYTDGETTIGEQEYMSLVRKKTAYIYAVVGDLAVTFHGMEQFAESVPAYREQARTFGRELGIAHQLFDDVLDFTVDTEQKDRYSDLQSQTLTLVTMHAADSGVPVFDESLSVQHRAQLVREAGSLGYTRKKAGQHMDAAIDALTALPTANAESEQYLREYLTIVESQIGDESLAG